MEMNCATAKKKTQFVWRLRSFKALHIFLVPSALQMQLHVLFIDQNLVRTQLALKLASDWFLLQHVKACEGML